MLHVTLKKDNLYDRLFKQIDSARDAGSWGTLGGTKIESEHEYKTEAGYVLEFKRLPDAVIEYIKTHKSMTLEIV